MTGIFQEGWILYVSLPIVILNKNYILIKAQTDTPGKTAKYLFRDYLTEFKKFFALFVKKVKIFRLLLCSNGAWIADY